ncbi:response regulator [candidate division TA06 bacterium]|nr:response regulator [candidate division TA06 bacterium]
MANTCKILVAEDDSNLNWVYQSILEEAGYQIVTSENGREALDKVHQVFPDLLITDAILPGMDGFELAEAVRGNPATRDIPIIFISGVVEAADRVRAASLGISQYLSKPVQVMELLTAVKTALTSTGLRHAQPNSSASG